jgi:hypothetical protein
VPPLSPGRRWEEPPPTRTFSRVPAVVTPLTQSVAALPPWRVRLGLAETITGGRSRGRSPCRCGNTGPPALVAVDFLSFGKAAKSQKDGKKNERSFQHTASRQDNPRSVHQHPLEQDPPFPDWQEASLRTGTVPHLLYLLTLFFRLPGDEILGAFLRPHRRSLIAIQSSLFALCQVFRDRSR